MSDFWNGPTVQLNAESLAAIDAAKGMQHRLEALEARMERLERLFAAKHFINTWDNGWNDKAVDEAKRVIRDGADAIRQDLAEMDRERGGKAAK